MKIAKLFILTLLFSLSSFSQITNENQLLLCKAFRYLHEQQYTLNLVKQKFPELRVKAEAAEVAFNNKFNTAINNIVKDTKIIFGKKYGVCLSNYEKEIINNLELSNLNKTNALNYINLVKYRFLGKIESPVLETILKYQYLDNPIGEYLDNKVNIHSVESYSNNGKFELKVKIPMSWKEIDGKYPLIIKKFRSEYGTGNEIITISKLSVKSNFLLKKSDLLAIVPKEGQIIALDFKKINTKNTGVIHFEEVNSKKGSNQKRQIIDYIIATGNHYIQVECAFYGAKEDDLNLKFNKLNPLFQNITQSILTSDHELLNNNAITYQEHN